VPPDNHYFAIEMEYFPGESLAQKLEHRSHHFGNTYERLFHIYEQVLAAIKYLANLETPIFHGDIKPHNILVGRNDLVKLTDFGSSTMPEEFYVRTRENGGTVLYAAPEFADCISRKGTFIELLKGDIYSLGVLLYQLTTNQLPHNTQSNVRTHAPFPKPREINTGISPKLEQVILKCLQKESGDRFDSIEELIQAFREARKTQKKFSATLPEMGTGTFSEDWSSDVLAALEGGNYLQAARVAGREYERSGDLGALLQQMNAFYRAEQWFDLEKIINQTKSELNAEGHDARQIRLIVIKLYMRLRKIENAEIVLKQALKLDPASLELLLCEASIAGMETDFELAKHKLIALNRDYPGNPNILKRLVQVSEQLRDYDSASGFLRALLRLCREDEGLQKKRAHYESLGVW